MENGGEHITVYIDSKHFKWDTSMQKQNHGEYECGFNVRKGAEVSKTQGISRHTTIHIISRGISKRPLIHSF